LGQDYFGLAGDEGDIFSTPGPIGVTKGEGLMKKFSAIKLGLLLGCCFTADAALAHSPQGKTYVTAVFSNFGTQFEACFKFDHAGNLTVGLYGTIIYLHDQLNNESPLWQATPVTGHIPQGFVLSFHGDVGGDGGQTIHANALNDAGDTFYRRRPSVGVSSRVAGNS
jgi:hypothetical protein